MADENAGAEAPTVPPQETDAPAAPEEAAVDAPAAETQPEQPSGSSPPVAAKDLLPSASHATGPEATTDDHPAHSLVNNVSARGLPLHDSRNLKEWQRDILEGHYQQQHKPDINTKKRFAKAIGVPLVRINKWFQNRRARAKLGLQRQPVYGFSREQDDILKANYQEQRMPSLIDRKGLAEDMNVPLLKVNAWFHYRLKKSRKELEKQQGQSQPLAFEFVQDESPTTLRNHGVTSSHSASGKKNFSSLKAT
ncbi:hypothetical protein K490DRAFT_55204 [Saccharata proteae CBS 121410]|uniref:Homeobox domain-containing protein n=1 Tax=Saccharata proteae CBS 121410 TaxID=1314787 RepID=A0A6A5YD47_9PEZI|nr:hypothetical protein K490DRAFT_55204 [Saccharata proteae CBS 121410]